MKKILFILLVFSATVNAQVFKTKEPLVHTFSIVARDEATGEMSVGVQSHWFSVGTAVPWAEAGVGAVATQSFVDKSYGPKALALLKHGYTAQQALDSLTKADAGRDVRQVAIIDTKGNIAAHTGAKCIQFASHIKGTNFSVQSNMMLGNTVCESMKAAFEKSTGKKAARPSRPSTNPHCNRYQNIRMSTPNGKRRGCTSTITSRSRAITTRCRTSSSASPSRSVRPRTPSASSVARARSRCTSSWSAPLSTSDTMRPRLAWIGVRCPPGT